MPLHDHPKMLGMLKVLSGKIRIQSYTKINQEESENENYDIVSEDPAQILDQNSQSAVLDENHSNFHEITALDEPAAFFDILSPPYSDFHDIDGERHCKFYRKLMTSKGTSPSRILRLEKINCPSYYYCDQVDYSKPDFLK
jgi:cysteamine dioxygenase